jgi:putative CocE/NonD family hydrolase
MGFTVATDLAVPLRDGVTLRADLWEPGGGAPRGPAILWRTPYRKEDALPCGFLDPRAALARGYRIVVQDVRGTGTSGGALEPFVNEEADGADTVAWIAAQPWSDGNVVMAGYSYVGAVQWLAAAGAPPGLRAIAPSISTDSYGEGWTFRDGVLELGLVTSWLAAALLPEADRWLDGVEQAFDGRDELLAALPWAADWFAQPADAPYWAARSVRDRRPDLPVLSIGGWYDALLAGTLAAHAAGRHPSDRLIVGPWAHEVETLHLVGEWNVGFAGNGAAFELTRRLCDFYDAVLAGRAPDLAPVTAYVLGGGRWLELDAWPPPGAATRTLAARGAGRFAVDPAAPTPAHGGRALRLWCVDWGWGPRDQRAQAARADVLRLDLEPPGERAWLAGPVRARLPVRAEGGATRDWVATLCLERPDGALLNLAEGIARRPVDAAQVAVELGDVCVELQPGERLALLVAGAAWPRWEPPADPGVQEVLPGAAVELTIA